MNPDHENILDEWLVMQAQDGDRQAYSILVKRWHPKMLRHAFRLTMDDEAAKDITQEAWKAIITRLAGLRSPKAFRLWAYRIISNKAADWIRLRQKEREVSHDESEQEQFDGAEHDLGNIRQALKNLPRENKIILTLFYVDGHSVAEISEILGLPPGTVKSRLFYSRKKLKENFEQINKE